MRRSLPGEKCETYLIGVIILAGLIHGLLYTFLVPPWQHYDEPGQFEYVWLVANRPRLPKPGDYDNAMRREVAASMVEHGFFEGLGFRPNLISQTEPIWIGISQTGDPPLYYWLAALPLRLVPTSDITFQLYLTRLVSLLLYLITLAAAYASLAELTPPGHALRWLVPATMALLPGFTDLMTAANNDVAAAALFTLFLWLSVQTIRRGLSLWRLLGMIGLAAACLMTKNTVALAIPLLIVPIAFSTLKKVRTWLAWVLLVGAGLALVGMTFTWGAPARWYLKSTQPGVRTPLATAPLGSYVLKVEDTPGASKTQLFQLLPFEQSHQLRGKTVTLGAWVWATEPVQHRTIILNDGAGSYSSAMDVGVEPTFYAISATVSADAGQLKVLLDPPRPSSGQSVAMYFDGIVLVEGDFTSAGAPDFSDPEGKSGVWGGVAFTNLLQNASAETGGLGLNPTIEKLIQKEFPGQPSMILTSLGDWAGAGWYYRSSASNMLGTFWGKFGWGHVSLPGHRPYRILGAATLAGGVGLAIALWRRRKHLPWDVLTLMGLALAGIWGAALVRGIDSLSGAVFIPSARYAYPTIVPTALALILGWSEFPRLLSRRVRIHPAIPTALYLLAFLGLDALSLWTIITFYRI